MKKTRYVILATIVALTLSFSACGMLGLGGDNGPPPVEEAPPEQAPELPPPPAPEPEPIPDPEPEFPPIEDTAFSGIFVLEGHENAGIYLAFDNNNAFNLTYSHVAMGLDGNGFIIIGGAYLINFDDRAVELHFANQPLENAVVMLADFFLEDVSLHDLLANPESLAIINSLAEEMLLELQGEFEGLRLYVKYDFDRLYSADGEEVFVRFQG